MTAPNDHLVLRGKVAQRLEGMKLARFGQLLGSAAELAGRELATPGEGSGFGRRGPMTSRGRRDEEFATAGVTAFIAPL